jgi:hypothetical protein
MNHNQYTKLSIIASRIAADYLNIGVHFEYQSINDYWRSSVYHNRIQKNLDPDEVVRDLHLKDGEELIWKSIKARNNYSRMQFFLIEVLYRSFADYQTIKKALKEFKF